MSKLNEGVKSNHYISGPQFWESLREYYEACEAVEAYEGEQNCREYRHLLTIQRRKLNECGVPLIKMINGLANNAKFSGYTWKDEMVADAYIKCTKALVGRKYKLYVKVKNGGRYNLLPDGTYEKVDVGQGEYDKYNPFSYFNRIAWREFLRRNRIEKEYVETRNEYIENHKGDFKEGDDTPIYVKPNFASSLGEFYDKEMEIQVDDD